MDDILSVLGGGAGGALGVVLIYLRVISNRLDEVLDQVKLTNGKVQDHAVRIAVLEDHDA